MLSPADDGRRGHLVGEPVDITAQRLAGAVDLALDLIGATHD
jgi:hypothetical protein